MAESQTGQSLTIKELMAATGLSISTLRRRVKDGSIPVLQLGGPGKKLLFPATVIETLCEQRAGYVDLNMRNDDVASDDTGFRPSPPAARNAVEVDGVHSVFGGISRPDGGPTPNWMRSPLLMKCKSNKDNSKNTQCQSNANTN